MLLDDVYSIARVCERAYRTLLEWIEQHHLYNNVTQGFESYYYH